MNGSTDSTDDMTGIKQHLTTLEQRVKILDTRTSKQSAWLVDLAGKVSEGPICKRQQPGCDDHVKIDYLMRKVYELENQVYVLNILNTQRSNTKEEEEE